MDRFRDAYRRELAAFVDVVAGRGQVACSVHDALEASYIAEAGELSRHLQPSGTGRRGSPVTAARIRDRVAGAPISLGVAAMVPGWGHQLAAERVLAEMRDAGLVATEFGPDGFLPEVAILDRFGLRPVGGFVPVVLHDSTVGRDGHSRREAGRVRGGPAPVPSCSPRTPGGAGTTSGSSWTTGPGAPCWTTSTGSGTRRCERGVTAALPPARRHRRRARAGGVAGAARQRDAAVP